MKLTSTILNRLEESMRVFLTPEQRVIMLYWYGYEPRHGWDEEDFVYGIRNVLRYYPDHREKRVPDFLKESTLDLEGEPF